MTREPNDPTRSGLSVPPGTADVALSRNEIEALCLKAGRGAGMDWGLAEEAGFAAAWLWSRGIDGPRILLAHLERVAKGLVSRPRLGEAGPDWSAPEAAPLCPIHLGASLCDFGRLADARDGRIPVGPVAYPALLLPFLADLARMRAASARAEWSNGDVRVDRDGVEGHALEALGRLPRARLVLSVTEARGAPSPVPAPPATGRDVIAGLTALALRTTVPLSEKSRAGAGAAGSDND